MTLILTFRLFVYQFVIYHSSCRRRMGDVDDQDKVYILYSPPQWWYLQAKQSLLFYTHRLLQ